MAIQTPRFWWDNGHLSTEQELGAFFFARQQWLDGLGTGSQSDWLGLNDEEFDAYMRKDVLPKPDRRSKRLWDAPAAVSTSTRRPRETPPGKKPPRTPPIEKVRALREKLRQIWGVKADEEQAKMGDGWGDLEALEVMLELEGLLAEV